MRQRRDEGVWLLGTKDARGVRVEGDGEGRAAEEMGAVDDLRDDALVAEVHAVEVADGGDDEGRAAGDLVELAIDIIASGDFEIESAGRRRRGGCVGAVWRRWRRGRGRATCG